MRILLAVVVITCGLCNAALGGTIVGEPEYQMPGVASPTVSAALPLQVGPGIFFWPADFLNFEESGPAIFYFNTDAATGESSYTIALTYANQTDEDWSAVRYEVVAGGDDSSVFLIGSGAEDDLIIDEEFLGAGGASSHTLLLSFGPTAPPATFELHMTPVIDVPEPGMAGLILAGTGVLLRRHRIQ